MAVSTKEVQRLRALAARYEEEGRAAAERSKLSMRRAAFCATMADKMEQELLETGSFAAGTSVNSKQNASPGDLDAAMVFTTKMFSDEHRLNMSKSRAPRSKLATLARGLAPPLTLAEVAEKAGISKSTLSQAMHGLRAMPHAAAEKIEALTGYPVSSWRRLS